MAEINWDFGKAVWIENIDRVRELKVTGVWKSDPRWLAVLCLSDGSFLGAIHDPLKHSDERMLAFLQKYLTPKYKGSWKEEAFVLPRMGVIWVVGAGKKDLVGQRRGSALEQHLVGSVLVSFDKGSLFLRCPKGHLLEIFSQKDEEGNPGKTCFALMTFETVGVKNKSTLIP